AEGRAPRRAEETAEVQPPKRPPQPAAGALPFDFGFRGLDQPAVRNAGGAHRLARATIEAQGQVTDRGIRQADAAFGERFDEEDAAARRVHLGAELRERRTVREAETAVHALVDAFDAEAVQGERRERSRSRRCHRSDAADEAAGIEDVLRVELRLDAL